MRHVTALNHELEQKLDPRVIPFLKRNVNTTYCQGRHENQPNETVCDQVRFAPYYKRCILGRDGFFVY